MGCDIHAFAERRNEAGAWILVTVDVFEFRNYGIFAFLAGVRNYSEIKPIAPPRGFPTTAAPEIAEDYKSWDIDAHTPSWLTISELLNFDYSALMEDRRYAKQIGPNSWDGAATCAPGEGMAQSWRQFLGDNFIEEIQNLAKWGAERIVFWFDN